MTTRNLQRVVPGLLVWFSAIILVTLASAASSPPITGYPNTAYLGVHIDDVTPERAAALKLKSANGVLITDLDRDGPACQAGLKENDVIVGFNGAKIDNSSELADAIHATPAGKTVDLAIIRSGDAKTVKVTLGSTALIAAHTMAAERSRNAMLPPVPYVAVPPDVDVPSFTQLSAHQGMVVESLTPQLGDYFGVPTGQGVLVRSVRRGSAAAAAGLKAGDVIIKVNNEIVHDMADWRRSIVRRAGKITVGIVRDKHQQTVELTLPGPADDSKLQENVWDDFNREAFEKEMQSFHEEMEKLRPQLEHSQREMIASIKPSQKELEEMQREIQESLKFERKDLERMTRDLQKSMPSEKDMARMRQEIEKSMPTQQQIDEMRHQVEDWMKTWKPQLQLQMEDLKKQMEQHKLDLPEMLKGQDNEKEF